MHIETMITNNKWQHFHYLVVCTETLNALAIDPLEADMVLERAQQKGWNITHIINTHEHLDHTGGNEKIRQATHAKLLAHYDAKIPHVDQKLHGDHIINVGTQVHLTVLDTPGHTLSHICLFDEIDEKPVLFSGDTLFQMGAGNCHHGGDPEVLYHTFEDQLNKLPEATLVYPGHDYLANNLSFALSIEPTNPHALLLQESIKNGTLTLPHFMTLREEKLLNPFLRCDQVEIEHNLRRLGYSLPQQVKRKDIFLALRDLRNKWQGLPK